ncbi:uncharacterized protein [Agelaius tricolor]|uniref:uncharacterized protein isoform X2 n=1 Tax=Agelaius tricolor TaxID=9191 RepID=UPI0039F1846B
MCRSLRSEDGRGSTCRPRGLSALCHQIPASSCPQIPLSLHRDGPFVPTFPQPNVPASRCRHFPRSLCPQVATSRCPHMPRSLCARFPVSARVRGDRGRAGSRYRGRFPVLPWEVGRGGELGGVLPVPAGSRRCGAARYRQGAPPPPPGRVKAPAPAPAPGGMARGALRLLCCAAALLAAAEPRPAELSPGVVAVISLAVCLLLAAVAALLVRRCRRGTPPFQPLDEVPMSKVTEGSPAPTPS